MSARCLLVLTAPLASTGALADTEIYRCVLEDGTMSFQESPCSEPALDTEAGNGQDSDDREAAVAGEGTFDFVNPFDEPEPSQLPSEPVQHELASKDRSQCENTTRNAIDAIDLEIRESTDANQARHAHLAELLELTRQLRACKQL